MIKLAFNKEEPKKVFLIDRVERVAINDIGVKECYRGTLVDTSTAPDTHIENYLAQVKGFEIEWIEVPVDLSSVYNLNNQTKEVTPSKSQQVVKPDDGYTGLDSVTVKAAPLEAKTATPSTSEQEIKATTEGKIGLSKCTVAAVTSAIDANIVAGNIKDGVTILGVTGSYVKPEDANLVPENIKSGVTIYGVEGTYTGQ